MTFEELSSINVSEHIEKKKTGSTELSYLSWVYAWSEFKKIFPKANYFFYKNEQGLPYVYDENTGYMCYVTVDNGEGEAHEMWLPVMDGANKAMKSSSYTYSTRYGEKSVEPATMFDVNKTLMRAVVKCIAMFGLGLYIFAGEDLPATEDKPEPQQNDRPVTELEIKSLKGKILQKGIAMEDVYERYKIKDLSELTFSQYNKAVSDVLATRSK